MDSIVRAVARAEALPTLTPGQVLDDTYQLAERIGGGGMGVVFRARDQRLGRDVAIKVLKRADGAASTHLRRLFEREARATAQLLHPNIVTLHHVGEHAGEPFLVLELLTGETLATRLSRRGKLPVSEALAILDAVLAALAFAHERGVLHRDLKPNNVFITVDERIKVLDFGVSLSLDSDPGPVTRAAGTPGYMAPEQRDGGAQDARTDVWAAALLLVECLLGRRCDERDAATVIAEIQAPSVVRAELQRALDVDPARRHATAGELRRSLARASARFAPAVDTTPRWRRHARLAVFGLAATAVGAGAMAMVPNASVDREAPLAAAEITGTWSVNFGKLALDVAADGTAYGVYEHDQGILAGYYRDGLFMGRWCELPTRRPHDDAGVMQLHFARNGETVVVDGRWTYGDAPQAQWHAGKAGFFGGKLVGEPSTELRDRLAARTPCP